MICDAKGYSNHKLLHDVPRSHDIEINPPLVDETGNISRGSCKSGKQTSAHAQVCLQDLQVTGPDSLVVRASASGTEGRGFAPRPRHTKGGKIGTGSSIADARNKRVELGRYKNAGRYLLLLMSQ